MELRIAIGADHRGYQLKEYLKTVPLFGNYTIEWVDVGTFAPDRTDYPIYAQKLSGLLLNQQAQSGILLCGTGTGMCIAANRFPGIYAGVAWNETVARLNREDDNCNVLVLPSDYVAEQDVVAIVTSWITAEFKDGRYAERIAMIDCDC